MPGRALIVAGLLLLLPASLRAEDPPLGSTTSASEAPQLTPQDVVSESVTAADLASRAAARSAAWELLARSFERSLAGTREEALADLKGAALSRTDAAGEAGRILDAFAGAEPSLSDPDDAWFAYGFAYQLWASGEPLRARARLRVIAQKDESGAVAEAARRALEVMELATPASAEATAPIARETNEVSPSASVITPEPAVASGPPDSETPVDGPHWSLTSFQLINGMALGIETCVLLDCPIETGFLLALGGSGVGIFGSYLYSVARGGQTYPGEAYAINAGTFWGAMNSLFIYHIADGDMSDGKVALPLMIGQLAGPVLGGYVWDRYRPTEHQVALANTFGVWGGVLSAYAHAAINPEAEGASILTSMLIAGDVGFVLGGFASTQLQISREGTYIIDGAGLLGATIGSAVATETDEDGDIVASEGAYLGGFIGAALGVAIGTYAAHAVGSADGSTWADATFSVQPRPEGGFSAGWSGTFD